MHKKIIKSPQAVFGLFLIALLVLVALLAPVLAPHDPELVNLAKKYAAPDATYPLGADQLGRCELSRLLYGARHSLMLSLPILLIFALVGLSVGTLSVCCGAKVDRVLTMICDTFLSFPPLIAAVAIVGILGKGIENIAVAVVVAMWAWFVRTVRSYAVIEMGKNYILAARISGCSTGELIFRHLIPNIMPQYLVYLYYSSIKTFNNPLSCGNALNDGRNEQANGIA